MKYNFNTSFCRYRLFVSGGILYAGCSVDRLPLSLEFASLDTTFDQLFDLFGVLDDDFGGRNEP